MKMIDVNRRDLLRGTGLAAVSAFLPKNMGARVSGSGTAGHSANSGDADRIAIGKSTANVETKYGKVAGYMDRGVMVFKGVPYGASTAGAGRFKAPKPPKSWTGVRSSRHFGPEAPQAFRSIWENDEEGFLFEWDYGFQSEDCLLLNVWTQSTEGQGRPVMLYLHGGGYAVGSSSELKMFDGGAHIEAFSYCTRRCKEARGHAVWAVGTGLECGNLYFRKRR
jgi:para-nitrobenzyl esterase